MALVTGGRPIAETDMAHIQRQMLHPLTSIRRNREDGLGRKERRRFEDDLSSSALLTVALLPGQATQAPRLRCCDGLKIACALEGFLKGIVLAISLSHHNNSVKLDYCHPLFHLLHAVNSLKSPLGRIYPSLQTSLSYSTASIESLRQILYREP